MGLSFLLEELNHTNINQALSVFICAVKRCRQLVLFHGQQCMDGRVTVKLNLEQDTAHLHQGNGSVSVLYACSMSACLTFYSGTLSAGTLRGVLLHQ